ncbi:MAG: PaaI family thioesterase [Synergistaceae bacterium]|jgi:uncharacterized protein (TIGR00369 family)|nr:PaaI family thioesterase [Synergistaceae bacterium]
MAVPDFSYSFGSGKDNPKGLLLSIRHEGEKSVVELTVEREQCGLPGVLHGGITFSMMDEAMYYAILKRGLETVTVSVKADYLSPGWLGRRLAAEGWVEKIDGKRVSAASEVKDLSNGKTVAVATGEFKVVDLDNFRPPT